MIFTANKTLTVFVCLLLCFALTAVRLYEIATGGVYTAESSQSSIRLDIANLRGDILDRNGNSLVNRSYNYIAAITPGSNAVNAAARYLDSAAKETLSMGKPAAVKVDESFFCENTRVFKVPERYSSSDAVHIIGYIDGSRHGVSGIEQGFDELLYSGTLSLSFKKDAHGKLLFARPPSVNTPQSTGSVTLTIDSELQSVVRAAAAKQLNSGAVVVLCNKTGQLLACCSMPEYSQIAPEKSLDMPDSPFVNKALYAFSCGSVFKPITAAAALENGITATHRCAGGIDVGSVYIGCTARHETLDMEGAMCRSCNCYFIALGKRVGAQSLRRTAALFGFGKASSICPGIYSRAGRLPTLSLLQAKPAELANLSFGQGELTTTPLQVAMMMQCIANNGRMIQPSIVKSTRTADGNITVANTQPPTNVISAKTAKLLQKYLISTVKTGTGKNAMPSHGMVGGKTATAQTGRFDRNGDEQTTTWFAGFCGSSAPDYSIVVMAERGESGSASCAPIFREIAEYLINNNI